MTSSSLISQVVNLLPCRYLWNNKSVRLLWFSSRALQRLIATDSQRLYSSMEMEYRSSSEERQIKMKSFLPSEQFLSLLSPIEKLHFQKVCRELEVYIWVSDKLPAHINDQQWSVLMKLTDILSRVQYFDFLANSKLLRKRKEEASQNSPPPYEEDLEESIVLNPYHIIKRVRLVQGSRILKEMRVNEKPKIIIDLQPHSNLTPVQVSKLSFHLDCAVQENLRRKDPFLITFANFKPNSEAIYQIFERIPAYNVSYRHLRLLPFVSRRGVRALYPEVQNVVYICNRATKYLEGPLKKKVYALCAAFDLKGESLKAAREERIEAVRFPTNKYVKWNAEKAFLPIYTQLNILYDAYQSCGDWQFAIENNLIRNFVIGDEKIDSVSILWKANEAKRTRLEKLTAFIAEATGSDFNSLSN